MSSPELEDLLSALKERYIDLNRDDISWAFDSSKTRDNISAWVQEYVSPATLLTREELALYVDSYHLTARSELMILSTAARNMAKT